MVSVPMETDPGGLVGVLNVHTVDRREFTARDVELLLVIGRLIAGALHQARLHRQLVARERAHENFVEQVIEAQEIERRRLAGDIHDGISQRLVTLSYRLDAATRAFDDPAAAAEQLGKARELVDLTLQEARAAIGGLRPPVLDDLGLAGGLASLARSIPQIGIDVDLADTRLPDHIEIALYRIAQECLQNVVKHARSQDRAAHVRGGQRHRATRNRRRRSRFRHLRASAGQRRDGRLRPAVDGRTRRDRRRQTEHPVAARIGHRGDGDDPAAVGGRRAVTPAQFASRNDNKTCAAPVPGTEKCRVVPTGQPGEFALRGLSARSDRRSGRRDAIVFVGHDEDGTPDPRGESARPVEPDPDRRPRGDRLLPTRIAVLGVECRSAGEGVGCGQRCDGPPLAGQRNE